MNEAYEVIRLLKQIEATGSRAEKEELLAELVTIPLGLFAVKRAYDPFITYGIKVGRRDPDLREGKIVIVASIGVFDSLLNRLATRNLTGNAAEAEIDEVLNVLSKDGAELLFRIISKDLKCGIGEATINNAVPGLIPVFCVMRANKFEDKRIKSWPVAVEPKLDGFRYTFICRNGNGGFFTRSGKRAPSVDHMVQPIIEVASKILRENASSDLANLIFDNTDGLCFVLDGEMLAGDAFNETSGALRRASEEATKAQFHIFDLLSFAEFDAVGTVNRSYADRRKLVENFIEVSNLTPHKEKLTKTPRYLANNVDEVMGFYEKFQARGLEGAMVKLLEGGYDKKKSFGWLKIKAEESEDLPIVGAFPGEPNTKYANCLGGLIVLRDGVQVRVGGGFSDVEREEVWQLWLHDAPIGEDPIEKKLLGRLIEVEYHEVTPDGSLRHPRFKCFRDDKAGEVESKEAA